MRSGSLTVLVHSGHGPTHLDLILGAGGRCTTLHLDPIAAGGWRWRLGSPHRRRYLSYRGPVPGGRGRVRHLYRTPASWSRPGAGRRWRIETMRGTWYFIGRRAYPPTPPRQEASAW